MTRGRGNRRRRNRRPTNNISIFYDWFGGTVNPDRDALWTTDQIEAPKDRPFKVVGLFIQVAPVDYVTGAFFVKVYNPIRSDDAGKAIWTTGPIIVGQMKYNRFHRISGTLWFPASPTKQPLISITHICQMKAGTQPLRYIVKVHFHLGAEQLSEHCPVRLCRVDSEPLQGTLESCNSFESLSLH